MQAWVANDYPGTKTAISEYNWGGQEHINGALAQADLLGIFGQYGLDLATLWGPPDATQLPGLMAFEIYRNYDGANSKFGDKALASTSAAQGQLAVYGALRSSDHAVTVVVINKTYGALTSMLSLANLTSTSNAQGLSVQQRQPGSDRRAAGPGGDGSGSGKHDEHDFRDVPGGVDHAVRRPHTVSVPPARRST